MTLWASTDLCFLDLPDTQPFPFYYRAAPPDSRLRLYYPLTPDFLWWLRLTVAAASRAGPIPEAELDKVFLVERYVVERYPNTPGKPQLPKAMPAEQYDQILKFTDGNEKYLRTKALVMWRPLV